MLAPVRRIPHPLAALFARRLRLRRDLRLPCQASSSPSGRHRVEDLRHAIGLRLQLWSHPLRPLWTLGAGPTEAIGPLRKVWTGMGIIHNPSPRQRVPGAARVGHRLEPAMVRIAGMIPCVRHRDQTQPLAVHLRQDARKEGVERGRSRLLTGCGHVPERDGPPPWPPAIPPRDGGGGALPPSPMTHGDKEAITPDGERWAILPCGHAGLAKPRDDLLDLRDLSRGLPPRTQARPEFPPRGAWPMAIVVPRQHFQDVPLGVIGGPGTHACGQCRCGQAGFKPSLEFSRMPGTLPALQGLGEAAPTSTGPQSVDTARGGCLRRRERRPSTCRRDAAPSSLSGAKGCKTHAILRRPTSRKRAGSVRSHSAIFWGVGSSCRHRASRRTRWASAPASCATKGGKVVASRTFVGVLCPREGAPSQGHCRCWHFYHSIQGALLQRRGLSTAISG